MREQEPFESEPPDDGRRGEEARADAGAERASARIREALRRGLISSDTGEEIAFHEIEALRAVARAHRGEPFALAPVCVELVGAVLRSCFEPWVRAEELWDTVARRIAETLFDDPAFHARMESLWARLQEEAP